ncbi:MAG: N-acetyl-gamma-glutamyl-phosphate reductase [Candidatus Sumerlaeota bacterium]|nr:N-acetyl-gamma-glutamyl-phosphate reductase [Candidatus Sumerlaeota bacterium]
MNKVKAAIVGAKGYAARELIAILLRHTQVELVALADKLDAPESLIENFPEFRGRTPLVIEPADIERLSRLADVVFLALPHKVAQDYAVPFYDAGKIVIDLSADFRFEDIAIYEKTYAIAHAAPALNREAVYGLPELSREKIKTARLIGSPGCYPTGIILACAPIMKTDWIDRRSIIADSKSGVSGAGRAATPLTHYISCNESIRAYSIATHRHTPEIEEKLSLLAGTPILIQFTPHLAPMDRGILSTIYVNMASDVDEAEIRREYERFYDGEPFVRILSEGQYPATRTVVGANYCDI